jgi:hypothetical protein
VLSCNVAPFLKVGAVVNDLTGIKNALVKCLSSFSIGAEYTRGLKCHRR